MISRRDAEHAEEHKTKTFWWDKLLDERRMDGIRDANKGIYDPPYPGSDDPQDEDENAAYKRGFDEQRKELCSKFKWA